MSRVSPPHPGYCPPRSRGPTYPSRRSASVTQGCQASTRAGDGERAARPCAGGRSPRCGHCGRTRSCSGRQRVRAEEAGGSRTQVLRERGQDSQHMAIVGRPEGQVGQLQNTVLPQVHRAGPQLPPSQPPQPHAALPARRHPTRHKRDAMGGPRAREGQARPPSGPTSCQGLIPTGSPGFIKKGHLERLDVNPGVRLREKNWLTSSPHLGRAPGHHHLQQARTGCPQSPQSAWPLPTKTHRCTPGLAHSKVDASEERRTDAPSTPDFRKADTSPRSAKTAKGSLSTDSTRQAGEREAPRAALRAGAPAGERRFLGLLAATRTLAPAAPPPREAPLPSFPAGPCRPHRAAPRRGRSCGWTESGQRGCGRPPGPVRGPTPT